MKTIAAVALVALAGFARASAPIDEEANLYLWDADFAREYKADGKTSEVSDGQ